MKRILVLDYCADLLEVFRFILEKHHFITHCCNAVKDMSDYLKEQVPDLMIIDVAGTGVTEKMICSELRHKKVLATVPIIITSTAKNHIEGFKNFCADAAIEKPFSIDTLLDKIYALLRVTRSPQFA